VHAVRSSSERLAKTVFPSLFLFFFFFFLPVSSRDPIASGLATFDGRCHRGHAAASTRVGEDRRQPPSSSPLLLFFFSSPPFFPSATEACCLRRTANEERSVRPTGARIALLDPLFLFFFFFFLSTRRKRWRSAKTAEKVGQIGAGLAIFPPFLPPFFFFPPPLPSSQRARERRSTGEKALSSVLSRVSRVAPGPPLPFPLLFSFLPLHIRGDLGDGTRRANRESRRHLELEGFPPPPSFFFFLLFQSSPYAEETTAEIRSCPSDVVFFFPPPSNIHRAQRGPKSFPFFFFSLPFPLFPLPFFPPLLAFHLGRIMRKIGEERAPVTPFFSFFFFLPPPPSPAYSKSAVEGGGCPRFFPIFLSFPLACEIRDRDRGEQGRFPSSPARASPETGSRRPEHQFLFFSPLSPGCHHGDQCEHDRDARSCGPFLPPPAPQSEATGPARDRDFPLPLLFFPSLCSVAEIVQLETYSENGELSGVGYSVLRSSLFPPFFLFPPSPRWPEQRGCAGSSMSGRRRRAGLSPFSLFPSFFLAGPAIVEESATRLYVARAARWLEVFRLAERKFFFLSSFFFRPLFSFPALQSARAAKNSPRAETSTLGKLGQL